jgi:hypothetical protein
MTVLCRPGNVADHKISWVELSKRVCFNCNKKYAVHSGFTQACPDSDGNYTKMTYFEEQKNG